MTTSVASRRKCTERTAFLPGLATAVRTNPEAPTLNSWFGLVNGDLSFPDFYQRIKDGRRLSYLTIDVTAVCDLACAGMCYYHPEINKRKKPVTEETIGVAVAEAERQLDLQTLVVAGKEPFLNPRKLFALLELIGPAQDRTYTAGTITNGRNLFRHWSELRQLAQRGHLDFLDISLDSGIASQHDQMRGRAGTFELAFGALRDSRLHLDNVRVGVSSVFAGNNGDGLVALWRTASQWTRHFFVTPMQPPPFSLCPPLSAGVVITFLRQMHTALESIDSEPGLEITVLLPGIYVYDAASAGLFEWSELRESGGGAIYVPSQVGGHTVIYTLSVLPEQACRVSRITSDGAYLAHLHFLQSPTPETYAAGFIQNESIVALYDRSIEVGSPFHRIIESRRNHQCRNQECWSACFGGWTVAENALLTGNSLAAQPRLCLKGR